MCENQPVSKIRIRSPGESVLTSAASAAPVPDAGNTTTGPRVRKTAFQPLEHLEAELGELGAAVIDRRLRDFFQHAIGNVRRPGNLQEVPPCMCHRTLSSTTNHLTDFNCFAAGPSADMNVLHGTGFP